ncbi:MAG TPA: choice-of-anchor tandem repeat NxxGxxAF-containing protein [Phycisphaerales bacterium]|nr:choice-of-anchor tandem repeat NxxGxxAF-containing protein [Phycisphaerales bacterium]
MQRNIRSLGALTAALVCAGASAQHVFDVVAMRGQPAPGIAGATFNTPLLRGVGPTGHVLFEASLMGVPPGTLRSTWVWHNGGLRLVVRDGDPAVGIPGNGTVSNVRVGHVDADGRVLWVSGVRFATPAGEAMWRETDSGRALIAYDGDPLPGASGGTVLSVLGMMDVGGLGAAARISENAAGGTRPVYYGLEGATPLLLARHGEPAPLFGPNATWDLSTGYPVRADGQGNFLFRAAAQNPAVTAALVYGPMGSQQVLAATGAPVPGMPGTLFGGVDGYDMSDDGTAVFAATLAGTQRAVFTGTPGSLTLLVKDGDPAPGLGNCVVQGAGYAGEGQQPQVVAGPGGVVSFVSLIARTDAVVSFLAAYRRGPGGPVASSRSSTVSASPGRT